MRGRQPDNTVWPSPGPIENRIETLTGRIAPLLINAGIAGWRADLWVNGDVNIPTPFATVIDRHIGVMKKAIISLGSNDANAHNADLTTEGGLAAPFVTDWKGWMQTIIDHLLANGVDLVAIPYIMYGTTNAWSNPNIGILNQAIDQLIASNAGSAILGPDLYAPFQADPTLLRDNLHPTFPTGYGVWLSTWADWFNDFYSGAL
jgi:hypothetical protein